ncbi:MAG: HAD-IB family phosphatase [Methyloceanibacter sp.]|nr:HAD-IB family phosphatase [Methyloceanibacter sp.]
MTAVGRSIDIVCFDCDSTLSRVEGIDALARRAGVESDVAPLTVAAMAGELALDSVYGTRMELVRPDRAAIEWLAKLYMDEMVQGAPEAVSRLREAGKDVHIISGGLRQAILPLAASLKVSDDNVHAVDVVFDNDGAYAGFDQASPLARPGGKAEVCRALSRTGRSLALVGDGATDIEARAAGALIVGFGGVVVRDNVKTAADIFVAGPSLTAVVDPILAQPR